MEPLASRLREIAQAAGLTDAEVARRAGLTQRRYAHYVSGTREPNLATLVRIAGVLGVTPNDLLLEDQRPGPRSNLDQLILAAQALHDADLAIVLRQVQAIVELRS